MQNQEAQPRTKKVLSEESRKRKRESDQIKGRTRINTGPAKGGGGVPDRCWPSKTK